MIRVVGHMRFCVIACASAILATLQIAQAQSVGGYDPPMRRDTEPHFEKTVQEFGRFTVTRSVEDYRNVPIVHGPWFVKEAVLHWQDSSGKIGFSFIDNGGAVTLRVDAASADAKTACIMSPVLVIFEPRPSIGKSWEKMRPAVVRQIQRCDVIAPADMRRAVTEMAASGADYPPAANAWKAVSRELFGSSTSRCVREKAVRRGDGLMRDKCTAYSKG